MTTRDQQYYEGLLWQMLRDRGRRIDLDGEDTNVWAFNTVVISGSNALAMGHSDFSVVLGHTDDWHKTLLGA